MPIRADGHGGVAERGGEEAAGTSGWRRARPLTSGGRFVASRIGVEARSWRPRRSACGAARHLDVVDVIGPTAWLSSAPKFGISDLLRDRVLERGAGAAVPEELGDHAAPMDDGDFRRVTCAFGKERPARSRTRRPACSERRRATPGCRRWSGTARQGRDACCPRWTCADRRRRPSGCGTCRTRWSCRCSSALPRRGSSRARPSAAEYGFSGGKITGGS